MCLSECVLGFFPFVEPGFEIDMECLVCQGKGCSVCKNVGWNNKTEERCEENSIFNHGD